MPNDTDHTGEPTTPGFQLADGQAWIGHPYVSQWLTIDQALIDRFADTVGDRQFIHVDPERAALTPFGGTIAHGFLVVSLISQLHASSGRPRPADVVVVNYGFERVRFVAPVRSGKRIRGAFTLTAIEERQPGRFQLSTDVTIEVEGLAKPALTAVWLTQLVRDS
jgi:acyl dehydratase